MAFMIQLVLAAAFFVGSYGSLVNHETWEAMDGDACLDKTCAFSALQVLSQQKERQAEEAKEKDLDDGCVTRVDCGGELQCSYAKARIYRSVVADPQTSFGQREAIQEVLDRVGRYPGICVTAEEKENFRQAAKLRARQARGECIPVRKRVDSRHCSAVAAKRAMAIGQCCAGLQPALRGEECICVLIGLDDDDGDDLGMSVGGDSAMAGESSSRVGSSSSSIVESSRDADEDSREEDDADEGD